MLTGHQLPATSHQLAREPRARRETPPRKRTGTRDRRQGAPTRVVGPGGDSTERLAAVRIERRD